MAEDSQYDRGQYAQFAPDGRLYVVADASIFRYALRTEAVEQLLAVEALGPSARILMGNTHAGPLDLPWLYGSAWILEGRANEPGHPVRFSHHLLFRLDLETGTRRLVFSDPVPAEVRCLTLARGHRAFGVACDCGHVFKRLNPASYWTGQSISWVYRSMP